MEGAIPLIKVPKLGPIWIRGEGRGVEGSKVELAKNIQILGPSPSIQTNY